MNILVTGGAGFIGSALIRYLINETEHNVINIDKLTYAGNLSSLMQICHSERYVFKQIDICDNLALNNIFLRYEPDAVMHLAAETHVDRSINMADNFIQANVVGTYRLLEVARHYWNGLDKNKKRAFKFHHISTDEVFGDLAEEACLFDETSTYAPSSPYSASKAGADHLVRAWHRTYGLPVVITNCSNNYGPWHFPEKFIPCLITNALLNRPLTLYGDGQQIRDWLYVEDHVHALYRVLKNGKVGDTYAVGGNNEIKNIDVAQAVCEFLEELSPGQSKKTGSYTQLITFVEDRPGHDRRYAINAGKIQNELGWRPAENFESGLRKTVQWYIQNDRWWKDIILKQSQSGKTGKAVCAEI